MDIFTLTVIVTTTKTNPQISGLSSRRNYCSDSAIVTSLSKNNVNIESNPIHTPPNENWIQKKQETEDGMCSSLRGFCFL